MHWYAIIFWVYSNLFIALYDFEAELSDELSIFTNDHLYVPDNPKEEDRDGWFYAYKNDQEQGYVPQNYVSFIS